jgi:hypothetical protein
MSSDVEFETEIWDLEDGLRGGSAFVLTAIEVPGGSRIKDLTPPQPSELRIVKGVADKKIELHYLAARGWEALVNAARADGIKSPLLLPTSGYRSVEKQKRLWENALKKHGTPEKARKWVAPPGGSAHQTGRAIDFYLGGSNRSENVATLRTLPAYKWLAANASHFGFYPYEREPWHWEYNPPSNKQIQKGNVLSPPAGSPSAPSSLYQQTQDLVRRGMLTAEVAFALIAGERDENKLTNLVFYSRYPSLRNQRLSSSDPKAKEWTHIKNGLIRPILTKISSSSSKPAIGTKVPAKTKLDLDDKNFKWHPPTEKRKYGGYSRYGGGRVYDELKRLRSARLLSIRDEEIELLQRIANVESNGLIQAINSWDSAFMSMGFMQWTIKFGKLQRLIAQGPKAFQRYGIELDQTRRYKMPGNERGELAIKGAETPHDLRSLEWAKRFYAAGLDPEIIVAEVKLAMQIIEETKNHIINHKKYKIGKALLPYYENSVAVRALVQETFNNRPRYLLVALQNALARTKMKPSIGTEDFLTILRSEVKDVYSKAGEAEKADRLIRKTGVLFL